MNTKSFLKAAAIAVTITTISGIPASQFNSTAFAAITLDDKNHDAKAIKVLEASIEALGGREDIESIKYMTTTGTLSIPQMGMSGTVELISSSPNLLRLTIDLPMMGGKTIQGVNGDVAWSTDAMNGPRILPPAEAKDLFKQADLHYILNFRDNYDTIEYVEETEFDGQRAHKLRLVSPDGNETIEYYAVEGGLPIGSEVETESPMGKISATTMLQDYKEIDGHLQPTKLVQMIGPTKIVMTFDNASFNEIDESVFDLPASVTALIKATAAKEKAAP